MTTATATYSTNEKGQRQVRINNKYTITTSNASAPAALDYKTDPAGNHIISVGNNGLYETVDMLQVTNKL